MDLFDRYAIRRGTVMVEVHANLVDAAQSYWVLLAHDLKNGHDGLELTSPEPIPYPSQVALPEWAVAELRRHNVYQ